VQLHRFLHLLDAELTQDAVTPVSNAPAFVLCPPVLYPGVAQATAWQQVYQLAFAQAERFVARVRLLERSRQPLWN
jgi:hypothetical protein